ncbi:hypothetical protein DPMN_140861 [Dreissena polymorpha]|uniref:Uncharacterized protein n=1 Tax=Dreissena polymorpha TaxID=45954 RepID=A0A9D4GCB0_DREPO|nr:hypothetical protein DPMN_140861 [Dreissena polymorpha]
MYPDLQLKNASYTPNIDQLPPRVLVLGESFWLPPHFAECQVFLGHLLFVFPWVFQVRDCLVVLDAGLQKVPTSSTSCSIVLLVWQRDLKDLHEDLDFFSCR